jgi:SAM-dependent methyltransferase
VAITQEEIYAGLDLDLSWSERELPERERTKHVHRLHPYLGKYVPQLVEELFRRHVPAGGRVLDPFAGSGTTLVQALESGLDSVGVDIAAFNCLLMRVKVGDHDFARLEQDVRGALARFENGEGEPRGETAYLRRWFAPQSRDELLRFRSLLADYEHADVLRVVLTRAARSARRTTHFDLDFPREACTGPYWCFKHRRVCRPVERAGHFLRRYALDTLARLQAFAEVRSSRGVDVLHGDARSLAWPGSFDAVVTSPPYPGLIDYHEQHRYAYELLGLVDRGREEIGAAASGTTRRAIDAYCEDIAAVLRNAAEALRPDGCVVIVVNDRRGLYDTVLDAADLRLDQRYLRHVNRRTGRRAGEYFEEIIVARRA